MLFGPYQVKLFLTSSDDRQPHDSGSSCSDQPLLKSSRGSSGSLTHPDTVNSPVGTLSPSNTSLSRVGGSATAISDGDDDELGDHQQLRDVDDDDEMTDDVDELSDTDTDDDMWHLPSVVEQTRI